MPGLLDQILGAIMQRGQMQNEAIGLGDDVFQAADTAKRMESNIGAEQALTETVLARGGDDEKAMLPPEVRNEALGKMNDAAGFRVDPGNENLRNIDHFLQYAVGGQKHPGSDVRNQPIVGATESLVGIPIQLGATLSKAMSGGFGPFKKGENTSPADPQDFTSGALGALHGAKEAFFPGGQPLAPDTPTPNLIDIIKSIIQGENPGGRFTPPVPGTVTGIRG